MKTIFLTGVSGFIGSNIAKKLLDKNYKVIAPIRKESLNKINSLNKYENLKVITGDFFSPDILKKISEKIDVVIHFASIRGEGGGSEKDYQKINVEGTESLLKFANAKKIPGFIYCSSVGVLGTIPENQPAGVNQKVNPDNLYHNSKWQSEQLVKGYHSSRLNTCIVRPTITYGTGDDGFLPKLIEMVKLKRFPLSSKDVYIHLLDVNAFSNLIFKIIDSKELEGKTYIVADKSPVLLKDVANQISGFLGKNSGWIKLPVFVLNMAEFCLKLLNQKKLLTSIQLINQSWTYQLDETVNDLGYQPSETFSVLNNYLKEIVNN